METVIEPYLDTSPNHVIPSKNNILPPQNNKKFPYIIILILLVIIAICGGYFYYINIASGKVKNNNKDSPTEIIYPTSSYQSIQTSTPTPIEKVLNLKSKGEVKTDNSVKITLLSAYEDVDNIVTMVEVKNDSNTEQKLFYFMFELTSDVDFDESKSRFVSVKAQPYDAEILLKNGEKKNAEMTFKKVTAPFIWYFWGQNKRYTLGSFVPAD